MAGEHCLAALVIVLERKCAPFVPLLSSLAQLLSDPTVLEQIDQSPKKIHSDALIEDSCDGTVFRNHPLFSHDPSALQIIAYYDALEICNPLGSHVKHHKLGIVFYSLGNVAPKFRSRLRLINLAIVATIPVIEAHGLNKILQRFVDDINELTEVGVSVTINGTPKTFKGALLAFLGDNLAMNDLGGFKKFFSFSFRSCRTCLVTHSKTYGINRRCKAL